MTNRELVIDVVRRLPEDIPLHEIAREIEFVAAVQESFEQLDRGEGVPIEEMQKVLPSWVTT